MKFEQTHWLSTPVDDIKVMITNGRVYDENMVDLGSVDTLEPQGLDRLEIEWKKPKRYALYNHDTEELATIIVFTDYKKAAIAASQLDNIIILALG